MKAGGRNARPCRCQLGEPRPLRVGPGSTRPVFRGHQPPGLQAGAGAALLRGPPAPSRPAPTPAATRHLGGVLLAGRNPGGHRSGATSVGLRGRAERGLSTPPAPHATCTSPAPCTQRAEHLDLPPKFSPLLTTASGSGLTGGHGVWPLRRAKPA